jgi:hypothetical protein
VQADTASFSFFARDALHKNNAVRIAEYEVVATTCNDRRDYPQIIQDRKNKKAFSDFDKFNMEPEYYFENVSAVV